MRGKTVAKSRNFWSAKTASRPLAASQTHGPTLAIPPHINSATITCVQNTGPSIANG